MDHHASDARVRRLTTKSQLIALLYAQFAGAQSLREIEQSLTSHACRLYHLGASAPARSTLADANAKRPAQLFADLFAIITAQASPSLRRVTREALHLVDATSIRLTDISRGWADYEAHGVLVKLHVDFDANDGMPANFAITPARVSDITAAHSMPIEPGATYVFDLGYYDFSWWAKLHAAGCRVVTRLEANTKPSVIETRPIEPDGAVLSDKIVSIDGRLKSARGARHPLSGLELREIEVVIDTGRSLRLVTNDLTSPAKLIAGLYKTRWQVELFFRWVKQHLEIKRFLGTSENAVRTQIAIALIAFLILRIVHQAKAFGGSLLMFARLVRANLMHIRPIENPNRPPPPSLRDPRQQQLSLC